jgi:soluble lytic murein transglycosylase-like protein
MMMETLIAVMASVLLSVQPNLTTERADHLAEIFVTEGAAAELDPFFLAGVASVETGRTFKGDLTSHAGACGLMQVIPRFQPEGATCEQYRRDDRLSVRVGAAAMKRWQRYEQRRCRGGHDYAAHYNSGLRAYPRSERYARAVRRRAKVMTQRAHDRMFSKVHDWLERAVPTFTARTPLPL